MKRFLNKCSYDYRMLGYFCFDSGIRAPTELMNIRYNDLTFDEKNGIYTLTIREETSKTFGRKIKLMFCSQELKNYLEEKKLSGKDQVFPINPLATNKYYQQNIIKIFGKKKANHRSLFLFAAACKSSDVKIFIFPGYSYVKLYQHETLSHLFF